MSRKPDYRVAAMNKRTDEKATVGAAWEDERGFIQIKFDAFVQLPTLDRDLIITLFPNKDETDDRTP